MNYLASVLSAAPKRLIFAAFAIASLWLSQPQAAHAYPAYAQAAYDSPREATGKIVCANCHLAQMPTQLELPQAILPNQVFEAVVKIPYNLSTQQVTGDGSRGGLNVGAVVVLPEGFRLATEEEMTPTQLAEYEETYIAPYSDEKPNILVVGPIAGDEHQEIVFPVKAPDPATDDRVNFLKYPVYVGANRGRGQINPDGSLSNNNAFRASVPGVITRIVDVEDPFSPPAEVANLDLSSYYTPLTVVTIETAEGEVVDEIVLAGPELLVNVGDTVSDGHALTTNPNVGGFGQVEREIVLQSPDRIKWLIAFLAAVSVAQIMLVLKKKQVEKVQMAEGLI